jgi:hypothetical protein
VRAGPAARHEATAAQHCGIEGRGEVRDGRGREEGRGGGGGPWPGATPSAGGGGMSARRPEVGEETRLARVAYWFDTSDG